MTHFHFQYERNSTAKPSDIKDLNFGAVPKGANVEGKPREAERECIDRYDSCIQFHKQVTLTFSTEIYVYKIVP